MGHRLLGQLPATRNWTNVVALLKATSEPADIAEETSKAADRGLDLVKKDNGFARTVFILMETVWASKKDNFRDEVVRLGMSVPKDASLLDVVSAFDDALDGSLKRAGHRSDLAEMARFAAVDALMDICKSETGSLFGVAFEDTQEALRSYATSNRFGVVGQNFFGKFLYRFLDYHLSRELPNHIGPRGQFNSIGTCDQFKEALKLHCHQIARIVKEFSGCWPSATEYREGLTAENVRTKFIPVALQKIKSELKRREGADA